MCSVVVDRSGNRPDYNEIMQIAIVPFDANFKPIFEPLILHMYPHHEERIETQRRDPIYYKATLDPMDGAALFEDWFRKHVLSNGYYRIAPLGFKIDRDYEFIKHWMLYDETTSPSKSYADDFFNMSMARDIKKIAIYFNDLYYMRGEQIPFAKTTLAQIAYMFKLEDNTTRDIYIKAILIAQIYQQFLKVTGLQPLVL